MGSLIGVLLGAAASYWVFSDARGRGYSFSGALLWSIGTFLLLIIFLPLYLLFGRRRSQPTKKQESAIEQNTIDVEAISVTEATVHCPMCGKEVKEDFKLCPYCGNSLKPKCERCGRELEREWQVCPDCQTPAARK